MLDELDASAHEFFGFAKKQNSPEGRGIVRHRISGQE
jgi:hypothetical protein